MINHTIHLIGVGGIGSWTAHIIVRLGCKRLVLYDHDTVELHNLENQNYVFGDIGKPKVEAMRSHLRALDPWQRMRGGGLPIEAVQHRVDAHTPLNGIVIVAVDSANARREIFSACKYHIGTPLYIEAAAAEDLGTVRVLVPHDVDHVKEYEQILGSYSSQGPAPCVSPYMGPQFASVIGYWLVHFQNQGRPFALVETSFNYEGSPSAMTYPESVDESDETMYEIE